MCVCVCALDEVRELSKATRTILRSGAYIAGQSASVSVAGALVNAHSLSRLAKI